MLLLLSLGIVCVYMDFSLLWRTSLRTVFACNCSAEFGWADCFILNRIIVHLVVEYCGTELNFKLCWYWLCLLENWIGLGELKDSCNFVCNDCWSSLVGDTELAEVRFVFWASEFEIFLGFVIVLLVYNWAMMW